MGLGGRALLALEQPAHEGLGDAEHAHEAGDATAAGQQAEGDLGQAELDLVVVDGDAVVAGEGDLEAATEGGTVDRGHDRLAEPLEAAQLGLDGLDLGERLARPSRG